VKFSSTAELADWARAASQLWLFLDYDGTLADFAPTPAHVKPHTRVVDMLEKLARRPATRLTIISGRRLSDIRQLIPVNGIFMAASYGVEILTADGELINRAQFGRVRPTLDAIKPAWQELIADDESFFLEDKGWTLALHARRAPEKRAEAVLMQAKRIADAKLPSSDFKMVGGYKFLEIAPSAAEKRETVEFLTEKFPLAGAQLIYLGDDEKDEEAFAAIHARGGIAVKVREATTADLPTSADIIFDSPRATLGWLRQLL
jgi:trehalose 6-phosphate phosphatase